MNETIHPERSSNVPWLTSDQRVPVPDAAMLPENERVVPIAVGLMNNAVQGAHQSLDRFAQNAAPVVRHLGDSVAAAADALQAKTEQLREKRDEWADGARTNVRSKPLVSVVAAFTLGFLIARITR